MSALRASTGRPWRQSCFGYYKVLGVLMSGWVAGSVHVELSLPFVGSLMCEHCGVCFVVLVVSERQPTLLQL